MKYTNYTINKTGKQEIIEFLRENHKKSIDDADYFNDESMLNAWAEEAEFSLSDGNSATIELRSSDSIYGYTQTITISDDGIDKEVIDDGDDE